MSILNAIDAIHINTSISGIFMILIGITGLVPLTYVVLQILYLRRCSTSFRYLILSKLVADGLENLIVMMSLVSTQLIFGEWVTRQFKPAIGYLSLSLQYSSFYTSIAMTVNRLLVVLQPLRYNTLFNDKTTGILVMICWLLGWIPSSIYLKEDCSFTFDVKEEQFVFDGRMCGRTLSLYQDLIFNVATSLIITTIDIYTLIKLNDMSKVNLNTLGRSKREKPWFLQATINSALYIMMLGSFHVAGFFNGVTIRFFLTVIAWQMWLSAAPYCIIILQKEFRTTPWKKDFGTTISVQHASSVTQKRQKGARDNHAFALCDEILE